MKRRDLFIKRLVTTFIVAGLTLPSLAAQIGRPSSPAAMGQSGTQAPQAAQPADLTAIQHIVFIIKENRTFDQMFGTYPGAEGATSGTISTGQVLPLGQTPDRVPRDIGHYFWDSTAATNFGRMDGFDLNSGPGLECTVNADNHCKTQQSQTSIPNNWE